MYRLQDESLLRYAQRRTLFPRPQSAVTTPVSAVAMAVSAIAMTFIWVVTLSHVR